MVRVFVAEDHEVTSRGIEIVLASAANITLVGTSVDVSSSRVGIAEADPDIVVLDLDLKGDNSLKLLAEFEDTKFLIFSGQTNVHGFQQALSIGAAGIVSKSDAPETLLDAIDAIQSSEEQYVSPALRARVDPRTQATRLTEREKQILNLFAKGQTSAEIAESIGVTEATVKKHRENLMRKLNVHSAIEAVRSALDRGLID